MKSTPKWLLIPPVVALLLVLGPLAMSGGTTNNDDVDGANRGVKIKKLLGKTDAVFELYAKNYPGI